jgi:hypothetical protein
LITKLRKKDSTYESSDTETELKEPKSRKETPMKPPTKRARTSRTPRTNSQQIPIQWSADGRIAVLPIAFEHFTVHSLGSIHPLPLFHTDKYIFPVGYRITR